VIYHVLHFHAAVSWVQGSNLLRPYGREEAFMQGRFNNGSIGGTVFFWLHFRTEKYSHSVWINSVGVW
jgi:hypothetical protein